MLHDGDPVDVIREWIHSAIGMVIETEQREIFKTKVTSVLPTVGLSSLDELAQAVHQGHLHAQRQVVDAVAINHTSFFREEPILKVFEDNVVKKSSNGESLRLWSAASATGQELYSLALIIVANWGSSRFSRLAQLMGTDISGLALSIASKGEYGTKELGRIPSDYHPFIEKGPSSISVVKEIKEKIVFRRLNLLSQKWPFTSPVDVIFCRNVLYYFQKELTLQILNKMYEVTVPGGWLFTSSSEPLRELNSAWSFVQPGVYRKDK